MRYCLVNGIKILPEPGLKGQCVGCGQELVAKCGKVKVWHWAHSTQKHCDPWWENETPWHRAWKAVFPGAVEEVPMKDPLTGEQHFADVVTSNGLVIELQNSPMSVGEAESREKFYKFMVWIVNAAPFQKNIYIGHELPHADSGFSEDLVLINITEPLVRRQRGNTSLEYAMVLNQVSRELWGIADRPEVLENLLRSYKGDHSIYWKNQRDVWLESKVPVYFDFGSTCIWQLIKDHPYLNTGLSLKKIERNEFIKILLSKKCEGS